MACYLNCKIFLVFIYSHCTACVKFEQNFHLSKLLSLLLHLLIHHLSSWLFDVTVQSFQILDIYFLLVRLKIQKFYAPAVMSFFHLLSCENSKQNELLIKVLNIYFFIYKLTRKWCLIAVVSGRAILYIYIYTTWKSNFFFYFFML